MSSKKRPSRPELLRAEQRARSHAATPPRRAPSQPGLPAVSRTGSRQGRASVTVVAVTRDGLEPLAPSNPFRLHHIEGRHAGLVEGMQDLLALLNRQWRRRRMLAATLALVLAGGGGFLVLEAWYVLGLALIVAGLISAALALGSGRYLEVEVETVQLCLALLEDLEPSVDPQRRGRVRVDMRTASHAAKLNPNVSGTVVDHWFTVEVPLKDGTGLQLELTEHVHGVDALDDGPPRTGKRMGREYHVALFADTTFDDRTLRGALCSHVSAPSGTSVKARVQEGLDIFHAAIAQKHIGILERRSRIAAAIDNSFTHDDL